MRRSTLCRGLTTAVLAAAMKAAMGAPRPTCEVGAATSSAVQPRLGGSVRVPGSSLLTLPRHEVREAEERAAGTRQIELTLHTGAAPAVLLATISTTDNPAEPASVRLQLPSPSPEQEETRLTGIEALYAYIVRQEPLRRIELTHSGRPRALAASSHGDTLRRLAQWRACVVEALAASRPAVKPIPWESAVLRLQRPGPARRQVAATVTTQAGRPVRDAPVAFASGEHLVCAARTGSAGTASCELFDPHGHEVHDDEASAPMVVTFGGVVGPERILLPTTLVRAVSKRPRH